MGIHSRSDTNRGQWFILLQPQDAVLLEQMLKVMVLNQHRVSSSKTVRPRASCGARYMGHAIRAWSAVCSDVSHLQFGEGVRLYLCMYK